MATEQWLGGTSAEWPALLAGTRLADTYHDAPYHRLAERRGEGEARLFVCRDESGWLALPMLLRPIEGRPGRRDAGSVYGYAGPVASTATPAPALLAAFRDQLRARCTAEGIVSVVARLHPLIDQAPWLDGLGTVRPMGPTVSIDLTLPEAAQTAGYRSNHRRDLKRLARDGYVTTRETGAAARDAFIAVYHENMRRVGAAQGYFFDAAYFAGLAEALGPGLDLFLCRKDGAVAGGALCMRKGPIAQYHLGAVADAHLEAAPLKQLLDAARQHYAEAGAEVFHLGGGRGSDEDSLFRFKAGFGGNRHRFALWCWVVDEPAYAALTAGREPTAFFPAYRAPHG
jgi:hypothetical protein